MIAARHERSNIKNIILKERNGMDNKTFIGRKAELDAFRTGFSSSGSAKAFLITGEPGMGKSTLLEEAWPAVASSGEPILWLAPDLSSANDEAQAAAALARGIDAAPASMRRGLSSFARAYGQATVELQRETAKQGADGETSLGKRLAEEWFKLLSAEAPELNASGGKAPTFVLAADDLDKLPSPAANWLLEHFLPQLDESGLGKNARYLFAGASRPDGPGGRFMESATANRIIEMPLRPLRAAECAELAKSLGDSAPDGQQLRTFTGGNPGRLKQMIGVPAVHAGFEEDEADASSSAESLDGFTPEETEQLFRASYLPAFTIDSLSMFFDQRKEASLAFHWLKNNKSAAQLGPGGALSLADDLRQRALSLHASLRPEESSVWRLRADSYLAFTQAFSDSRQRRIPLLLSLFHCFDSDLLKRLFTEHETEDILRFVEAAPDHFEQLSSGSYKLNAESAAVTNQYKEHVYGGGFDEEDLRARAEEVWAEKRQAAENKRNRLDTERANMEEEILGLEKQIDGLGKLKVALIDNFRNPEKRKAKRHVTFTISMLLVIIGLIGVAASLAFRDMFEPYHAIAGLFLTLVGFFWPMTSWESAHAIAGSKGMDRFAIETQQRMLGHRVGGLNTRINRLRQSVNSIGDDLRGLDESLSHPYLG